MSVVVDIRSMRDDLRSFGKAAKNFIQNNQRLAELEVQLLYAAAEAKRGDRQVRWGTDLGTGGPVRTELSSSYRKRNGAAEKQIAAEISFNFSGQLAVGDDNKFIVRSGGTRVRLWWNGADEETLCHFDIHPSTAGHPMLHIQFEGVISELPRLHSLLAHPLDVLEFTLMEVFQERWRRFLSDPKFASEIRKFPENQRKRLLLLLGTYAGWINSAEPALFSLLRTPPAPFDLYPVN